MKRRAMGPIRLCLALATLFVPLAASADNTPDPCSDNSCPVTCGGGGSTCIVQLKLDKAAGVAQVLVNGSPAPLFCTDSGTQVKWVTANARSSYAVAFNPKHTPFGESLFLGDAKHPYTGTATNHGGNDRCYVYSFVVCNKEGQCQHADPKVVIHGPPP